MDQRQVALAADERRWLSRKIARSNEGLRRVSEHGGRHSTSFNHRTDRALANSSGDSISRTRRSQWKRCPPILAVVTSLRPHVSPHARDRTPSVIGGRDRPPGQTREEPAAFMPVLGLFPPRRPVDRADASYTSSTHRSVAPARRRTATGTRLCTSGRSRGRSVCC